MNPSLHMRLLGGFALEQLDTPIVIASPRLTFFYKLGIHGSAGMLELRGRNFLQFEVEVSSTVLPAYAEPTVIRPSVQRDNITMMLVPEL